MIQISPSVPLVLFRPKGGSCLALPHSYNVGISHVPMDVPLLNLISAFFKVAHLWHDVSFAANLKGLVSGNNFRIVHLSLLVPKKVGTGLGRLFLSYKISAL